MTAPAASPSVYYCARSDETAPKPVLSQETGSGGRGGRNQGETERKRGKEGGEKGDEGERRGKGEGKKEYGEQTIYSGISF